MKNPSASVFDSPWHPFAAGLTWLLPGLGHALLGQPRRGLIVGATILALWLAGLVIGGISVLDRREHPMWFYGQMLLAPSVAVDVAIEGFFQPRYGSRPDPDQPHGYQPSFGRVNEQGILYTALAGLLNLLAILDVLYKDPDRLRARQEQGPGPVIAATRPGGTA